MQALVEEMGGELPLHRLRTTPSRIRLRLSPSVLSESPFDDDGSSSSSAADTVSDASSVHTPRDSVAEYPVLYRTSNSDDALIRAENGLMAPAVPVASPPHSLVEDDVDARQHDAALQEYTSLHARNVHLRSLLTRVEVVERNAECDRAAQLEILEIKSKRRAWSVRALLGRACADQAGFATPQRSSPLARCAVITPETLASGTWMHDGTPRRPVFGGEESEPAILYSSSYDEPCIRGTIPFPAMDGDGDDFCSTGPQDPLPLFAHPTEGDPELEDHIERPMPSHVREAASASCSAVDLPGMLYDSTMENAEFGIPSPLIAAAPMPHRPEHPQTCLPIDVFGDGHALEAASCDEFTLSLGGRDPYMTHRGRSSMPQKFVRRDWMMELPVDCR